MISLYYISDDKTKNILPSYIIEYKGLHNVYPKNRLQSFASMK